MASIGIVTEGPTDHVILSAFLPACIAACEARDVVHLQPFPDRTSSSGFSDGGWPLVKKWCLNNPPKLRRQISEAGGLFRDSGVSSSNYDILLLVMDADTYDDDSFRSQSNVDPENYDLENPKGRGEYISAVLFEWLWGEEDPGLDLNWTIISPAVIKIETWLLSSLGDHIDPEELGKTEVDEMLVRLVFSSQGMPVPENAKKIKKSAKRYNSIVSFRAIDANAVREKCPHFDSMIRKVDDAIQI